MTVFELVVLRLTRVGRDLARQDPTLYSASYDNFVAKIWIDKASTQGLPPEVFVRALKTAYREVTGIAPPPNPSDQHQHGVRLKPHDDSNLIKRPT